MALLTLGAAPAVLPPLTLCRLSCRICSCAAAPSQVFLFTPASAAATKLEEKKSTLTADVSKATAALAEVEGEVARLKAKLYSKFGGVRFFGGPTSTPFPLFSSFLWACVCWSRQGRCGVPRGGCRRVGCGCCLLECTWRGR